MPPGSRWKRTASLRSITEPNINNELARLYGNDSGNFTVEQAPHEFLPASVGGSKSTTSSGARYVGESWYASYVLSHSASMSGHANLHHAIELHPTIPARRPSDQGDSTSDRASIIPGDLPPSHLIERLLEDYFARFHVFCPILDRRDFLESVRDGTVSQTLLRCVLFVASIHCESETLHRLEFSTRVDAGDDLFGKACAAFDSDQSSDRLTLLLSSYLLHYWFGKPTTYRDALWWLATAIRSAQCMGYHRSTRTGSLADKRRWKRIWWCLYVSTYAAPM